jgi:hypothetical protein
MQPAQGESIMEKQPNSRMCFVCGIDNPIGFDGAPSARWGAIGLHLAFYTDEEGRSMLHPNIQPEPEHQGFAGQLQGGIISGLLDVPTQISIAL